MPKKSTEKSVEIVRDRIFSRDTPHKQSDKVSTCPPPLSPLRCIEIEFINGFIRPKFEFLYSKPRAFHFISNANSVFKTKFHYLALLLAVSVASTFFAQYFMSSDSSLCIYFHSFSSLLVYFYSLFSSLFLPPSSNRSSLDAD